MKTIITLEQIRSESPCDTGWKKLLSSLNHPNKQDYPTTFVSIGDIAKSNGAQDALWATRCLPNEARRDVIKAIMPSVRRASAHTEDKRVQDCIAAIDLWLGGDDSMALRAAADAAFAAVDAARAALARADVYAADAAARAARAAVDAARADVYADADAAADAADAAGCAAAYAAANEGEQQVKDIIAVFPLHALSQ